MKETKITEKIILEALSQVQEPELNNDLVTLKMIRDIEVRNNKVSFTVLLTTPACPLRGRIEEECREAVMRIPGVAEVSVNMSANVPQDGRTRDVMAFPVKIAIAVGSGKGGVGKSTIAVNLAVYLARKGAKVGLLDADIYGPNIPTMMGVDHLPPPQNNRLIPAEIHNVKLMSIGFLVNPGQPLIWRGPMLHTAIRQLLSDTEWGGLDYLIIDLPPGTGDAQLSLAQLLPLSGSVIVTLPQKVSIDDASRAVAMFQQLNVPILGILENMSYLELPDGSKMEVFGNGGGERLARESQVEFLGKIPMLSEVREGGDLGTPIILGYPESSAGIALANASERIAAAASVKSLIR